MTVTDVIAEMPDAAKAPTRQCAPAARSVSVIIPARNAAAFIREAVDSALAQDHVAQVVVIDDGSTDATASIVRAVRDDRLRLVTNGSAGVSAARNLGARIATGQWLLFLDADDRLRPGAVSALLGAAGEAPQAVLVYGDYNLIDSEGRSIGRRGLLQGRRKPSGHVLERLASGNFIVNGGIMLVRADAFRACGGFDETLKFCEDWHCWCRMAAVGEFAFVPALLLDYRVHPSNTMSAAARSPRDFVPAVDRVFADRLILSRLPAGAVAHLRKAVEIHLLTYSATQAVRFGRYRDALAYLATIGRRAPMSLPRSAAKLAFARLGL